MRISPLSLAVCLALPGVAAADTVAETTSDAAEFDRVVVTATRTERAIADVPNTVDVIDRERMDTLLVRDIADLFRYEPGVTVGRDFGRFGLSDIRIRGLGGNRVRIQTDGIAVSDAFSIGSFSNANRNFVDLDTLKRVEVVRGPSSALYGSDALGGVVSFITKDPSDYLGDGKDAYFGFKLGAESASEGLFAGATAAFGGERWSGLVAVGHRQGKETENMGEIGGEGSARTQANPQSTSGRSVLGKLVFAPSQIQRFRLTVEGNEDDTDTDVLTSRGLQALTGATNMLVTGDDHQSRARVAFGHEATGLSSALADSVDWQVYRQDSRTRQDSVEVRRVPSGATVIRDRREREFHFDQRTWGLQANALKSFATGSVVHDLAYGVDVARSETKQKRDGRRIFLDTGAVTNVMLPDVFPVRDFPISETTTAALYVQDEIQFADGAFRLVPAVRVDHYRLSPQVDDIFREDNPTTEVVDITETRVSPKLGAVWHFSDAWSLFGGYSAGFRAPPYNDVNIGFTNFAFGYTAIPNPDLRPETSDGLELGLRFAGDAVHASLSAYYTEYDDFIESQRFIGFNDQGLMVYQSQNVADARIRGAELKAGVHFGAIDARLDGWSLRGAAAWSEGEDRTTGDALASVDPLTATLGLAYDNDGWGAELAGRFVGRRDRLPPPPTGIDSYYESPGYGVLDFYAHWSFAPGTRVNVGVFNLADRRYWPAGSVPLVSENSLTLDRYTASGRNVAVSLSVEF
ncbi:TonB-dependent hemoglobin/transferrin/lactoferrin family receptor [Luteimonas sp. BDR2-5]|uniref:TonB-dependent hemoglobin/transferrin/lactoferrin family receptor n=1 Tax=Proluteimonas luteida TaxID=2878685 RepID=UPI001E4D5305|nr:TonB-dependent hemoglobin/transferrin/lactoferrin family receptor [Luteimonas sp. BDR2-5]MCD9027502.1 TonB-dependent hemoglobin/transferrin/lactoferrin family receptor [Luteimonas sp. BDR2-5]